MAMQGSLSVGIKSRGSRMVRLKNVKSTWTIRKLKQYYCDVEFLRKGQLPNMDVNHVEFISKGKKLSDAKTLKDCGIGTGSFNIVYSIFRKKRKSEERVITFTLKIQGKESYSIPDANKNWTISKCKFEFLKSVGVGGKKKAALYAQHEDEKWQSPNNNDGIQLRKAGMTLSDDVTLGSLGIINGCHIPLVTTFRNIITFTLKIQGKENYSIPGANKNWTISQCKFEFLKVVGMDDKAALYAQHKDEKWQSPQEGIVLKGMGKDLSDDVTLGSLGIINDLHVPLVKTFSEIFEECNNDWKIMYERCPLCLHKNPENRNKLAKYYWYHGSKSAEYRSSKPNSCWVVIKGDKIRCGDSKCDEADGKEWTYKCPNHGNEKIKL